MAVITKKAANVYCGTRVATPRDRLIVTENATDAFWRKKKKEREKSYQESESKNQGKICTMPT